MTAEYEALQYTVPSSWACSFLIIT